MQKNLFRNTIGKGYKNNKFSRFLPLVYFYKYPYKLVL